MPSDSVLQDTTSARLTTMAARLLNAARRPGVVRAALLLALAVAWVNFFGTVKWAGVPGSLNGWKRPWYGGALLAATILACLPRPKRAAADGRLRRVWLVACVGAAAFLVFVLLSVFPPGTWSQILFLDDWPARLQSTLDGIELLRRGAVNGWQWHFLGGYHTSSNLSQTLTMLAFVPVTLFGPAVGFHALHAAMVLLLPLVVFWDLRQDGDLDIALLGTAFGSLCTAGLFGTIMASGDTNSIAGLVCAAVALAASHAARLGRRWGWPLLVLALSLTLYSHAAFFLYAAFYLFIETVYYRDLRGAVRSALSLGVAALVGLPLYWELLRYGAYTSANNVAITGTTPAISLARQVFYNIEILAHPHRWLNDYVGLAEVFLPILAIVASGRRQRAGFHAVCALATIGLLRLNASQFGYLFTREMHMLAFFVPAALAAFIVRHAERASLALALAAVFGLYVQTGIEPVPSVKGVEQFNPALVKTIAGLDGNLVLIENNPHRDMDLSPDRRSVRSPFRIHFEALLPAVTGKSFYGSEWDGWVWSSYRRQVVAGGTFAGQAIERTPPSRFVAELRRWGIRYLVVWSEPTVRFLSGSESFEERWSARPWRVFALRDADVRSVVTPNGSGALRGRDLLGAEVVLNGVRRGDPVVVRTNFYPAWRATWQGRDVPTRDEGGQLAFAAPADGDLVVRLEYPAHRAVNGAILAVLCGVLVLTSLPVAGRLRAPVADIVPAWRNNQR